MSISGLEGWTPTNVVWQRPVNPLVDWCRLGEERFVEPFFEQTIAQALRDPAVRSSRRQTPVTRLEDFENSPGSLSPRGFIFHLSRCGSTLVAQLLAALSQNLVLSEAPPIEQLLEVHRRDPGLSKEKRVTQLRGLITALGWPRHSSEQHLFIKFDSWQILDLPLLLEAFPGVPWIFIYRDPVEIMVSHHRQRGTQMIPVAVNPARFGFEPGLVSNLSPNEYCARVLAKICDAAATYAPLYGGQLVNFNQLPSVVSDTLGEFFGVEWSRDDLVEMRRASLSDAKTPALSYTDDSVAKQREASAELRRLVEVWLREPYQRLESLRSAQVDGVAASAFAASASNNSLSQSFTTQSITR